jgi:hypothetical protein
MKENAMSRREEKYKVLVGKAKGRGTWGEATTIKEMGPEGLTPIDLIQWSPTCGMHKPWDTCGHLIA